MDDLDLNIATNFDTRAGISSRDIAHLMGLSTSTVRRRVTRMVDDGEIENRVLVDIEIFPEMYIAVVGMSLGISPDRCMDKIRSIPHILYVLCVTGKYDVIAIVVITSRKILSKITRQLIDIEGVNALETFIVTDNYGLNIPAAKLAELKELEKEYRENEASGTREPKRISTAKGGNKV